MPKDSLNIYMTIQDGMSPALASITDKTKALDKETQQLQQTTNAMTKANQSLLEKQTRLQSEYDSSKKKLKEFQKAYDETHDVIDKTNLDNAIKEHAKLKNELAEVTEQLNSNKRAYKENVEEIRKGGLSTSVGTGDLSSSAGAGGVIKALVAGQVGQMLSDSVGGALNAGLTSAFGTPQASLASDIASGLIQGGAAGVPFGLWGILGGAALGGASGFLSGQTKIWEAKDDAFKDYYGGLYEDVSARSDETVESGSTIAAGREKDKISFTTLFKSEDKAERYLDELVDMANTTPFLYDDLTAMSKTLATYGYNDRTILPQLQVIGDTGAALGMNTSDMTAVAQALGRMKSSGKTTLEYLNILNDRGIGAVGMLADAKGVSVGDMYKMISDGKIAGGDAVNIITAALKELYSGSMLTQSQTYEGVTSTLEGLTQELQNAAGEGYNTLRTEGKREEVNALSGDLGESMKEINALIGENRARKENLEAQYQRETLDAVLNGKHGELWGEIDEKSQGKLDTMHSELLEWKAKLAESEAAGDEKGAALASANIEALYEEAQATGKALFDNSEFMKILNETERDEIQAILDNTAGLTEATKAAYELAQQLSKGRASAWVGSASFTPGEEGGVETVTTYSDAMAMRGAPAMLPAKSHAYGLRRVPYDGYPALLHEGERVLTKSEAEHALAEDGPRLGADPEAESSSLLTFPPPLTKEAQSGSAAPDTQEARYPALGESLGPRNEAGHTLAEDGPRLGADPEAESSSRLTFPPPLAKEVQPGSAAPDTAEERYPPLRMSSMPPERPPAAGGDGGGIHVTITGNDFVGTGEEMADQIAEVLVRKIEQAYTAAGR